MDSHDALLPGTLIDGLLVERVLAASNFAVVYLVREADSERRYAIKEYLPAMLARRADDGVAVTLRGPAQAEAFERGLLAFSAEAHLLERRTHPALLRVLRFWQANGTIYRQMPYCEGTTLLSARRTMDKGPDEATLRRLLFGLLGALQMLHDAGETHGDVSPGNILLQSDDRPMLLDTGAVRRALVGERTLALMAGLASGFGSFEAEPAAPDEPLSPAADLFALAAVAHFAVTGRLIAPGESFVGLTSLQRSPFARDAMPPYNPELLEALDAALSPLVALRPKSASQFRAMLSGQGEVLPRPPAAAAPEFVAPAETMLRPAAEPASTWVQPARRRHRNPAHLVWWTAGSMALLLLAAGSWVVLQGRSEARRQDIPMAAPKPIERLEPPAVLPAPLPSASRRAASAAVVEAAPAPSTAPSAAPPRAATAPKPAAVAAVPAPQPARPTREAPPAAPARAARSIESPREECGARTEFALYHCMQKECQRPQWSKHPQCKHLRETDSVD